MVSFFKFEYPFSLLIWIKSYKSTVSDEKRIVGLSTSSNYLLKCWGRFYLFMHRTSVDNVSVLRGGPSCCFFSVVS